MHQRQDRRETIGSEQRISHFLYHLRSVGLIVQRCVASIEVMQFRTGWRTLTRWSLSQSIQSDEHHEQR